MQYCYLPASSLQVSRLSLGTMMFGGQTDESSALAIMDYAFDHGINVFDTANVYNEGRSEQIVGKALQGRRDRIILATKVRNAMGKDVNCEGLSRSQILYQAEQSLRRLNTDYIDIYYLHKPDYHTPIEETMEAVSSLVRAGKVRYIGVSNYAAWQLSDILALCDKRNYIAPVITQNVYNMITRGLESELLPCIDHHKVGLTIYNPIAGGLLAGKHHKGEPEQGTRFANNASYYKRYWMDENFDAVDRLRVIAQEAGISLLELAMRWCVSQKHVTSIITGVSKMEQIVANIDSIREGALPQPVLDSCDAVWKSLAGSRYAYNR